MRKDLYNDIKLELAGYAEPEQQFSQEMIQHVQPAAKKIIIIKDKETEQVIEIDDNNFADNMLHDLADSGAGWWVLGFAAIGALVVGPKFIKRKIKDWAN